MSGLCQHHLFSQKCTLPAGHDGICVMRRPDDYVAPLAHAGGGMGDAIVRLQRAAVLSRRAEEMAGLVCDGCGTNHHLDTIREQGGRSCCPERKMVRVAELWRERNALQRALEQIAKGAALGREMFKQRQGERRAPIWHSVNVLQDNLAACEGAATKALEDRHR